MKAEFKVLGRFLIVDFKGELDHHNAKLVRQKIDQMIKSNNIKNIIFNFENMAFMDSSGIGIIMGRYKMVSHYGGKVAVTNVGASIDRIFNLSGLYKIVKKYDDVDQAIEAI